jgi:hypothetical protein
MPIFEVEANGQTFEIDAPDMNAAMSAFQSFSQPKQPQEASFNDRFGGMAVPQNAPALDDELQRSARIERGEPSNKYAYGAVYPQMVRESVDAMSGGARQAMQGDGLWEKAKGAGTAALGAASYVASPINAALRVAVGNPVEQLTGVPKEYSEFAAGLALPGIGLTRATPKPTAITKAPTSDQLKDAYVAAKNSPEVNAVQVQPSALSDVGNTIASELSAKKFSPVRAKETFALLDDLTASPPNGAVLTLDNIDDVRHQLGLIAGGLNKTDAAAAQIAKKKLDEWAAKIPQADVLAGDTKVAAKTMAEGRANYAGAKLADALDKRVAKAEMQTAAANSGMNLQNQLRQKVNQFLESKDARGLSDPDRKRMQDFVKGTVTQNVMRGAGNVLGGGGGLGTMLTGAGGALASGSPLGALLPAVGFGLKALSNALTARQAERLSEVLRSNTPLGKQQQAAMANWAKYAQAAQSQPMTPRLIAMLTIQARNLANNLKDAGIAITPQDVMRSIAAHPQGRAEEQQ